MTYNILFKYCVHLLQHYGKLVHMSYEEINIWIFVIIEPMVFLIMLLTIIYQFSKIKTLKETLYETFSRKERVKHDPSTDNQ